MIGWKLLQRMAKLLCEAREDYSPSSTIRGPRTATPAGYGPVAYRQSRLPAGDSVVVWSYGNLQIELRGPRQDHREHAAVSGAAALRPRAATV